MCVQGSCSLFITDNSATLVNDLAQEGQIRVSGLSPPPPPPPRLSPAAAAETRSRQEGQLVVLLGQPVTAAAEGIQEQELQEDQELKEEEEADRLSHVKIQSDIMIRCWTFCLL